MENVIFPLLSQFMGKRTGRIYDLVMYTDWFIKCLESRRENSIPFDLSVLDICEIWIQSNKGTCVDEFGKCMTEHGFIINRGQFLYELLLLYHMKYGNCCQSSFILELIRDMKKEYYYSDMDKTMRESIEKLVIDIDQDGVKELMLSKLKG